MESLTLFTPKHIIRYNSISNGIIFLKMIRFDRDHTTDTRLFICIRESTYSAGPARCFVDAHRLARPLPLVAPRTG
jgi:hypothetical protein